MDDYIFSRFTPTEEYRRDLVDFFRANTNSEMGGLRLFDGTYSHLLQNPRELADFIFALKKYDAEVAPIRSLLEIGFSAGMTNTILNRFFKFEKILAIDDFSAPINGTSLLANLRFKNLTVLCGRSDSERALLMAKSMAPFDLVFIDGGHTYDAVRADVTNYTPMLAAKGVLALHDIAATAHPDVARVWSEVSSENAWKTEEFVCRDYPVVFGIGAATRR